MTSREEAKQPVTTRDELVGHTPGRVWLRVCGGGITMPSGKSYMTMIGDNRPQDRHTEYVRADFASRQEVSVEELASIYGQTLATDLLANYVITKRTTEG